MSDLEFLHQIREKELFQAINEMPSPNVGGHRLKLLEIGAGTGRQAKILKNVGFDVIAIDLPSSAYKNQREFEIEDYDGQTLPCDSRSVDIAFSSNVLEHVREIDPFLEEIFRVLRDDGDAIHLMPTASWRFWSTLAHYGWIVKKSIGFIIGLFKGEKKATEITATRELSFFHNLFPHKHGERGNVLTETFYFSEKWWLTKFSDHGFEVKKIVPNEIFYTNASLLNFKIPFTFRSRLAKLLGSSCKMYVLKKSTLKDI